MRYRLVILLASISLIISCGTWKGSLRPTVNLTINNPQPNTVQAWGYPSFKNGSSQAMYNSVSINIIEANPFYFTFPDGFTIKSNEINESTLSTHLSPVVIDENGRKVSRLFKIENTGNYSIVFAINNSGHANQLSLYSCKHSLPRIITTLDKNNIYDFPLYQTEIENLFGHNTIIGHDFVIIGYECD